MAKSAQVQSQEAFFSLEIPLIEPIEVAQQLTVDELSMVGGGQDVGLFG